jgi:pimeloyl-ACP methyl ester carboxylesterase
MTRPRRWLAAGALLLAAWPAAVAARVGWRTAASLHPPRRPPAALREGDGFEDVAFRARDGTPLSGTYHGSANGAVVLFGHGYGGNRDDMRPQAEALIQRGYGVLLFDWRGHGASGGERTTWGAAETSDLQGALDLACPRPGRRCGAVGFSMGGMVLAQVAARDVRLGAIVLEGTPRSLADMLRHDERRHGALGAWAAASTLGVLGVPVASVRPIAETCAISPRPLLLVYGDRDEALAPGTAEDMLAAACAPKRLHLVRGATHLTYATAPESDLAETLVSFFDAALAEPR